ncbi:MAG: hypothetical protein IKL87_08195 [Oscillospiraceae bacterium]|nr:hypothetical protein [Oscillospiraceae bacterium]
MEQILKVLIGDDGSAFSVTLAQQLREKGFQAFTRLQNASALQAAIRTEVPDVMILDLTNLDAESLCDIMGVIEQNPVNTAVVLPNENTMLRSQFVHRGIKICVSKPLDVERLANEMLRFYQKKPDVQLPEPPQSLEFIVTAIIQRLGVPANLQGYHYLREAIIRVYSEPQLIHNITKRLYPEVAKNCETTPTRVERSIRHAIDLAWERDPSLRPKEYLGLAMPVSQTKPTNSELIAMIADQLRMCHPDLLKE